MKIFSHANLLRIIGALPALIIMVFIFKIFIFSDTGNWQKKYSQFSVPAMFVLANCSTKVSNIILCVMILVFWSPVLG